MEKLLFVYLLIFSQQSSCREMNVNPGKCGFKTIAGDSRNILGKWKVVHLKRSGMSPNGIRDIDLTCSNVYYEFLKSGIVKISSDDTRFTSKGKEVEYVVIKTGIIITQIKIKNHVWPADVTDHQLILDELRLDGSEIRMFRIK